MLDEQLGELEWQKKKLTENDGMRIRVLGVDPVELDTGYYQIWDTYNMPPDTTDGSNAYWNVDVLTGVDNTKQILAVLSGSGKAYLKNIHKGSDRGWKELTNTQTDTGWVPFQLINGAATNTAFKAITDNGFDCAYRIEKRGSVTEKSIRINASKVSHAQQIAQLPEGFVKNVQFHYVRVPINQGYGLVGVFPSGAVYVYIESDKRDSWDSTSQGYYFYGEFNWKE